MPFIYSYFVQKVPVPFKLDLESPTSLLLAFLTSSDLPWLCVEFHVTLYPVTELMLDVTWLHMLRGYP